MACDMMAPVYPSYHHIMDGRLVKHMVSLNRFPMGPLDFSHPPTKVYVENSGFNMAQEYFLSPYSWIAGNNA
jgi:hypothetical protein